MNSRTWGLALLVCAVALALGLGWTLRPSQAELPDREAADLADPEPQRSLVELEEPLREPIPASASRTAAIPPDASAPKPHDEDDVRSDLDRLMVELRASGRLKLMRDAEVSSLQADVRAVQRELGLGRLRFPQLSAAEARAMVERMESAPFPSK